MRKLSECLRLLHSKSYFQDEVSTYQLEQVVDEIKEICSLSLTKADIGNLLLLTLH